MACSNLNQKKSLLLFFDFFETGSHYVALVVLELTTQTSLASNSQRSTCLCLLSTEIKGMPN